MSTELEKIKDRLPIPIELCIDIAYRSMRGELIGIEDIAAYSGLTRTQAIALITNPIFNQMVHHLTLANAKHSFDAIAFNELIRVARFSLDEKNKIAAIKVLGDMVGRNESKVAKQATTNINLNIDTLVRNSSDSPFKGF